MSRPKDMMVQEFAEIVTTELEEFVKRELKNQKENPDDYTCDGETEPKFDMWFGNWMENFSCGDCILPENQEKIGG